QVLRRLRRHRHCEHGGLGPPHDGRDRGCICPGEFDARLGYRDHRSKRPVLPERYLGRPGSVDRLQGWFRDIAVVDSAQPMGPSRGVRVQNRVDDLPVLCVCERRRGSIRHGRDIPELVLEGDPRVLGGSVAPRWCNRRSPHPRDGGDVMDCPRPRSTRDSPEPERHRHGWRWPRGWPGVVREEREDAEALPDPRLFGRSGDRVDGVDVGPAVGPRLVPRLRNRADTDGDGLNDSEEINLGSDGFATDPWKVDTDADGWSDGYETLTKGTNPLAWDTDGDGVRDSSDLDPLHNLLVAVRVNYVHH